MASGVIASIDEGGNGTIAPDSRGEPIRFIGFRLLDLMIGDRVWFLAKVTPNGVMVTKLRRSERLTSATVMATTLDNRLG